MLKVVPEGKFHKSETSFKYLGYFTVFFFLRVRFDKFIKSLMGMYVYVCVILYSYTCFVDRNPYNEAIVLYIMYFNHKTLVSSPKGSLSRKSVELIVSLSSVGAKVNLWENNGRRSYPYVMHGSLCETYL